MNILLGNRKPFIQIHQQNADQNLHINEDRRQFIYCFLSADR